MRVISARVAARESRPVSGEDNGTAGIKAEATGTASSKMISSKRPSEVGQASSRVFYGLWGASQPSYPAATDTSIYADSQLNDGLKELIS